MIRQLNQSPWYWEGQSLLFTHKQKSYPASHAIIEVTIRHNIAQMTSTSKAFIPCLLAIIIKVAHVVNLKLCYAKSDTLIKADFYYFQETRVFFWKIENFKELQLPEILILWNFAHAFYLVMSTKGCMGFFLFCLDLELLIKV